MRKHFRFHSDKSLPHGSASMHTESAKGCKVGQLGEGGGTGKGSIKEVIIIFNTASKKKGY